MEIHQLTETELISACLREDRKAQQALFDRFAPLVLGVCRRYLQRETDAHDALAETMVKVLTKLADYRTEGSFFGWIKKIAVNESLMILRKQKRFDGLTEEHTQTFFADPAAIASLQMQDIIRAMDQLPAGYRTIFNLYAIEGYKHREIAEMLGISINTSKSQYALAKERLQALIKLHDHGR